MLNYKLLQTIKENRYAELIIAFLLFFPCYNYYIQTILGGYFGYEGKTAPALLYGIGAVCGVLSYFRMTNVKLGVPILLILAIGTFIFQSLYPKSYGIIHTSYSDFAYSPDLLLFLYALPLLFWNLKRINLDLLLKICLLFSRGCIILFLCSYGAYLSNLKSMNLEYMTFSYNALSAICFCIISDSNSKNKLIDRIIAIAAIIAVFISGSRGCSICILSFVIMYFLFIKKVSVGVILLCSLVLAFFLTTDINNLLMSFSSDLEHNGIHSRTISRLLDNSFATSNDREYLKDTVAKAIWDSPILGYGVWGDRAILNGFVHNVAYELLCSYGVIIGGLILIWIHGKSILSLIKKTDIRQKKLLCATIPFGLIQLYFSGSYLNDSWFFFLIALLASISIKSKTRNESFSISK